MIKIYLTVFFGTVLLMNVFNGIQLMNQKPNIIITAISTGMTIALCMLLLAALWK